MNTMQPTKILRQSVRLLTELPVFEAYSKPGREFFSFDDFAEIRRLGNSSITTASRESGFVVCQACSVAWR